MQKKLLNTMSAFMAISPALAMYLFLPGAELAKFVALLFAFLVVFIYGVKYRSRVTINFYVSVLVVTFISTAYHMNTLAPWFSFSHVVNNLLSTTFTFIPLFFLSRYVNPKVFIRTGVYFGLFVSFVVIWQRLMEILTGTFPNDFFLPGLDINRDLETFSIDRPSACFTEPAHLCIFLLPVLFTTLLYKKYILSAIFTFAILCSGSTTGFLMVVILLLIHILENESKHKWRNIIVLILCSGILYFLILMFFPQIILENFEKLGGVQEGNSDIRLLGPLEFFKEYNSYERIFGITLNLLEDFLAFKIRLYDVKNFANGALFMLLSFGYLGFFFLLLFIVRLWKACPSTKGYLIVLVSILLSDQILFNPHFMYLVFVVLCSERLYDYIRSSQNNALLKF